MADQTSDETGQRPDYWNVKVYDADGRERETIRGLTAVRASTLMRIFDREGVRAQSMGFDESGEKMLDSTSVNWDQHSLQSDTDQEDSR